MGKQALNVTRQDHAPDTPRAFDEGRRRVFALAGFVLISFAAQPLRAQNYLTQIGAPAFTTARPVELGFINMGNGNLHQDIPLASFPQRGSRGFATSMVYDSRVWQVVSGSPSNTWQPTNAGALGGWRFITNNDPGSVSFSTFRSVCDFHMPQYTEYSNFTWTTPDGTQRDFSIDTLNDPASCIGGSTPTGDSFATDSSGYHMYVTNYTQATVFAPDGTQVFPSVEDTNGNYFSKDANGNVIDTLGRTPVKVITSCNGNPNQTCYDILNSQGGTLRVTVTTTSISVNTAFGQSGVTEYSGTLTVIQSIALPDGTNYAFSYDAGATAGHYGVLTNITLPTGGQISYGYTIYQDSLGNRNSWVSSHTSGGGTWSYTPSVISTCASGTVGCQQSVTLTKPSGDTMLYTFTLNNGAWDSQIDSYTGAVSPANLMATSANTWDFSQPCSPTPCAGASHVRVLRTTTTLPTPGGNNVTNKTEVAYIDINTSNAATIKEWKFYAGASPTFPTTPDRETDYTYLATPAYTTKNIVNRMLSMTLKNGAGNQIAQTTTTYDSYGTSGLTAVPPVTQHDDTNFGTGNTTRGNPTQMQTCTVVSPSCSSYLTNTLNYDTTGQILSVQDSKGNITGLSYTDSFYMDNGANPPQVYAPATPTNAYLTQLTLPLASTISFGYYFNTGKRAFSRDQNGADSYRHFLDSRDRLTNAYGPTMSGARPWTLTTYAASGTQLDTYSGISDTSASSACTGCRHDQVVLDNLGRMTTQKLASDPEGATSVTASYDSNGRLLNVSNPFRSTADSTYGLEIPTYEAMDRLVKITHADNTYRQTFYGPAVAGAGLGGVTSQLCSSTTYGLGYPMLFIDEATKKRQTWTDGFGKIIEVDEPDSNGNLASSTCIQYDSFGNLTQVVQGSQSRTYAYDPLSRVTAVTTPETTTSTSGTTYFYYTTSTGGLCSGDPLALCRRTDPRGITTTYSYDALNRLTGMTYSDNTTPAVTYSYDQTNCTSPGASNGLGKLTGMSDGSGSALWCYDAAGHITTEKRTIAGIMKTILYTYNLDGSLSTLTYPSGRVVTYQAGNAGRPLWAKDLGNNIQYAVAASYSSSGALSSVIYGSMTGFNGVTESRSYNNRLEFQNIQATSSAGTALNLSYCFNQFSFASECSTTPTNNNGNVTGITNSIDAGRSETISYDTLNRISSATSQATSGSNCWGQSFGPDRLANLNSIGSILQCSSGTLSVSVDGNNHITNAAFGYDAAGNMTQDGSGYTYSFDAENRINMASGMSGGPYCYIYDGKGQRVEKKSSATTCSQGTITAIYWRSIIGDTIAESDSAGNITNEYVFFAGRRIARRDSVGNVFYYYADHLGNTRTITQLNGIVCYDAEFTPYGQEMLHTNTCPQNYKFTGYERDVETGLDYAFARFYNPRLGRFMSADPWLGDINDPQTMNRYAYVRNSPVNLTDPSGLVGQEDFISGRVDFWSSFAGGVFSLIEIPVVIGFTVTLGDVRPDPEFIANGEVQQEVNIQPILGSPLDFVFLLNGNYDVFVNSTGPKVGCTTNQARVIGAGKVTTPPSEGAFRGVRVTSDTAAIIPTQFFPQDSMRAAKNALTPYLSSISGIVGQPQSIVPYSQFSGVTDVIGGKVKLPDGSEVLSRDHLQNRYPGKFILELNGVSATNPLYKHAVVFQPPEVPCPTGTTQTHSR